jgi:hypothetical protein
MAGMDVSGSTDCINNGKYSAQNLYTGVPRFGLMKADDVRDICVRIVLEATMMSGPGLQAPAGWAIGKAEITNHASDCVFSPSGWFDPPIDQSAEAIGGTGSMTLTHPPGMFDPCSVSVHGTLEFAPGAPWVPAVEPLNADDVSIVGGCS